MTNNIKQQLWDIVCRLNGISEEELAHYLGVAEAFTEPTDENYRCLPVALFHDLVEDQYIGMDELTQQAHLTSEQVAALDAITRRRGERYFDYIARLKTNEIARKVKIADLSNNIKRCACDLPTRWGLLRRYAKAYGILIDQWKEYEFSGDCMKNKGEFVK